MAENDSIDTADRMHDELKGLLESLDKLSPREIKAKLGGQRTGAGQPTELLTRWLKNHHPVAKMIIKTQQNVDKNLIIELFWANYSITYKFKAGKSLQEFLGIHKPPTSLSISIISDQLTVITAFVVQCGGKEEDVVRALLNKSLVADAEVIQFIADLREHTEWYEALHEDGVYPADVFASWDKLQKANSDE
jgi:hypothetical protein